MSSIQKTGQGVGLKKIAENLESAGRAIVAPGTLDKNALGAFVALKGLTELAKFLPPKGQELASRLLMVGMQNLMKGADPTAREAVRGYTSTLAVARGLVPEGLLEKAVGKQQKQALYTAAKDGDVATVKSILRHNKKTGVNPTPSAVDTRSDLMKAAENGTLTPEMAAAHKRDQQAAEQKMANKGRAPESGTLDMQRAAERMRSGQMRQEAQEAAKKARGAEHNIAMQTIRNTGADPATPATEKPAARAPKKGESGTLDAQRAAEQLRNEQLLQEQQKLAKTAAEFPSALAAQTLRNG